jgi:outer membrane protein OmpA-like peptidoglycan-associated protein
MKAPRRNVDRKTTESVERMWQVYADHIGLPKAGEAESDEPLPRGGDDAGSRRRSVRLVAESAGRIFGAVAGVVVVTIAGITLWLAFSSSPDTAARRSQPPASAPAGGTERPTQQATPGKDAGEVLQASPPSPSSGAIARSDPAPASRPAATGPKPANTDTTYRISFDFGSDYINAQSRPVLDRIAGAMKANRDWRMAIEGHTDAHGTPDFNRALSERRAQIVKAYLQAAGIAPGRLSAVGFGASRPVAPNDSAGSVLNRRVELHRQ